MNAPVPEALLQNLRRYAEPFENHPPGIFARFEGGAEPLFPFEAGSDRGLGVLLLCAALYRPEGEEAAFRTVAALYGRFGNDLFRLNRISFETLDAELQTHPQANASDADRKRIPGILRSVCDFFYRTGPLGPWLAAAPDWEACALQIAHEIYWMGSQSRLRAKARYFFWLTTFLPGFAERFPQAADFLWPVGEGAMRFYFGVVKPDFKAKSLLPAEERLRFFRALGRAAFPTRPWKLVQPLDAHLRRGGPLEYVCRNVQGGCRPCPLSAQCPAAPHFLPSEA